MGVSENSGTPKSSILIGFSIIFTIQFGGIYPYFRKTLKKNANTMVCKMEANNPNLVTEKQPMFEWMFGDF